MFESRFLIHHACMVKWVLSELVTKSRDAPGIALNSWEQFVFRFDRSEHWLDVQEIFSEVREARDCGVGDVDGLMSGICLVRAFEVVVVAAATLNE